MSMTEALIDQTNAGNKPTGEDVIAMSGDLMGAVALAYDSPVDFDGVTISVLREPGTNRLLALIVSPMDMHGDEPFARYQVHPDKIPVATRQERTIILPT
jgi:hypothetical protein